MTRSADNSTTRSVARGSTPTAEAVASPPLSRQVWFGLLMAAFFVRFYLPAESAAQGDTLWIAALGIICGLVGVVAARGKVTAAFRWDWRDAAVAVWIGGQVAAGLWVVFGTGDKRAAINMIWEWAGVGMIWLSLRCALVEESLRRSVVLALIVTGTVISGLGLYQHYVSQPQVVAEFGPLFDQLRAGNDSVAIRQKLARAGIPTEEPGLTLFEKRLRDSREPLGLFALANTLGGFLAVCLVLSLGQILAAARLREGWSRMLPWLTIVGTIGWCLLLTKSRTAWIGCIVGIAVLVASRFRFSPRSRNWLIGGVVTTGLLAALLFRFGGLDRQVLSEAPKSLSYRLQYWQATCRMIADHPWAGVGPGNFRQHYLRYKLPAASEEIADPHNLFFDVAATGGVFSLAGLVAFLVLVGVPRVRRPRAAGTESPAEESVRGPETKSGVPPGVACPPVRSVAFWCAGAAGPIAFVSLLCFAGEWEDRLLILTVVWLAIAWVVSTIRPGVVPQQEDFLSPFAALATLCVHLLGAGGIAMPAISQLLLALAAISARTAACAVPRACSPRRGLAVRLAVAGVLLLAFTGLISTALRPDARLRWWMQRADASLAGAEGGERVAQECYRQAAEADPLSPEPWRHQFELASARENQSNESFETAVKQLREVMARDPVNFWGPRAMGKLWLARWRTTHEINDAKESVIWLRRAHQSYPTNAELLAELAFGLQAAGEGKESVAAAQAAIRQDEIYRKNGHVDRYLSRDTLIRLQQLIANVSL